MDKQRLKEVMLEQRQWQDALGAGISRDILPAIRKYIPLPHAVVISGIRRTGKSTLLTQILRTFYPGGVYYFNFEDERLIDFTLDDFNRLYEVCLELLGERKVFFFDEIQNVPKWELFVRRMQDSGFKFFITGSNASLLSKELATKLTGRSVTQPLYPFSFKEFLLFKGYDLRNDALLHSRERGIIKGHFNAYLRGGGMPEYLKYKDPVVLKKVYEDILYRDIVARYEIKDVKALRELGLFLLSNVAGAITYNSLKKLLHLGSANTVKSYADHMENSFLIFNTTRFSYSLKQQFAAPKKIYCIDNGLIEAVAFQFSKNKGKFLENLVFLELKRRDKEIYYYKTVNNREVDFVLKEGKRASALLQVSESLADEKVRIRETGALMEAMDELKLSHAMILTEDSEEDIHLKNKTITVKPVYKWLLETQSDIET